MNSLSFPLEKISAFEKTLVEEYIQQGMKSKARAYRTLRNDPKLKPYYIRSKASEIFQKPFVKAYLDHLLAPSEERAITAVEKYIARTEELYEAAKAEGKFAPAAKLIEIGAKLEGAFGKEESDISQYLKFRQAVAAKPVVQAQKVEVTVNVNQGEVHPHPEPTTFDDLQVVGAT